MFLPDSERAYVFGCQVPNEVLSHWRSDGRHHVIGLIELYPAILALRHWRRHLEGQRVLLFIDNWPALDAIVKGDAAVPTWREVLMVLENPQEVEPCYLWVARVASSSNIADAPSRGSLKELAPWKLAIEHPKCPLSKAKQTPAQRKMSAAAIAEKLEAALAVLPALNTRLDELTERQSRLEAEGRAQSSSSKAPLHTQLGLPTEAARGKDVPVKQIVSLVGPPPKRGTEVQRLSNDPEPPNVVQEAQEHLGPAEEGSMMQALMTQSAALTSLVSHLAQQSGGDPLLDLQASGASAGARGFQKGAEPAELKERGLSMAKYVERFGGYGQEEPPAAIMSNRSLMWVTTSLAFLREQDLISQRRSDVATNRQPSGVDQDGEEAEPGAEQPDPASLLSADHPPANPTIQAPHRHLEAASVPLVCRDRPITPQHNERSEQAMHDAAALDFDGSMSFIELLAGLPRRILACNTKFSRFLASTFRLQRSGAPASSSALFPLPVPYPGVFDRSGPKMAQGRFKSLVLKRGVHIVTMCLNYVFCGRNWTPLAELRRPPSSSQEVVYDRIRRLLCACGRLAPQVPTCPGRRSHELTACLQNLVAYAGQHTPTPGSGYDSQEPHGVAEQVSPDRPELRPYSNLCASRLKISGTGHFWPVPYLQPNLLLPFLEPRILRFTESEPEKPHPSRCTDSPQELHRLYDRWNQLGLLSFSEEKAKQWQKVRVFNARKSDTQDRQIGDRRSFNATELSVDGPSRELPPGALLCSILLRPKCLLCGSITDRRDFYHQIMTSPERASCNPVGHRLPLNVARGFVDCCPVEREGTNHHRTWQDRISSPPPKTLQPVFTSIFQGDHVGVEVATSAHEGVLQEAELLDDQSRLRGGHPCPPGPTYQGLIIDDFFTLSEERLSMLHEIKANGPKAPTKSKALLDKALIVYDRLNIPGSPEKDQLNELTFIVAGAQIDSSEQAIRDSMISVASPAAKRCALCLASLAAARLRVTSRALLERIAGSWVHCMMYRRPTSIVFAKIYRLIHSPDMQHASSEAVFSLSRGVADELVLASVLSFMMTTNIGAQIVPTLFASDASMAKGALVSTPLSEEEAALLWRTSDRKGGYSRLDPAARALLRSVGDPMLDEARLEGLPPPPAKNPPLKFDFLEIGLGTGVGQVTACCLSRGIVCCPPLDPFVSRQYDLRSIDVLHWVVSMLQEGRILSVFVVVPETHQDLVLKRALAVLLCARSYDRAAAVLGPYHLEPNQSEIWAQARNRIGTGEITCKLVYKGGFQGNSRILGSNLAFQRLDEVCRAARGPVGISYGQFSEEIAGLFTDHLVAGRRFARAHHVEVAGLESPVLNDFLSSRAWGLVRVWSWKYPEHINLLELRGLVALVKGLPAAKEDRRVLHLFDSSVSLAAATNGRTSSHKLRRVLCQVNALALAKGVFCAEGFAPTRLNVADDPTRSHEVRSPAGASLVRAVPPEVLGQLARVRVRRFAANWLRLAVLLTFCVPCGSSSAPRPPHSEVTFDPTVDFLSPFSSFGASTSAAGPAFFSSSTSCGADFDFDWTSVDLSPSSPDYSFDWTFVSFACLASYLIAFCHFPGRFVFRVGLLVILCRHGCLAAPAGTGYAQRAAARAATNLVERRSVLPRTDTHRQRRLADFSRWLEDSSQYSLEEIVGRMGIIRNAVAAARRQASSRLCGEGCADLVR
ncbi:unnamed protein product [Symbiodinium microadriaticum]|nr:unnamed protein product [Symbiodinium microadriaticum]